MSALLELRDLSVRTGETALLRGISFAMAPGERLGLIGESGSGKSLTALAVQGLLPRGLRASGSARLAGQEVVGTPDAVLAGLRGTAVATVFQEPSTALDPLMRVGAQVAEPLRRRARRDGNRLGRGETRDAVLQLLADVLLPDPEQLSRRYPFELSGGQRQRVAIAMALACRPALLIADEPTTALDVTTQREILSLIDRLVAERGMALLFIGHDLAVVARAVGRIVVLRHGETVEAGPVSEVFANPRHDYTRSLLAAARRFDDALEGRR